MSRRRNLALWILNAVMRFAPVGAGEWVNAMSSEIDFIENDWAALSWALGGTRILFTRPGVQLGESGVVPWSVEDLARKVRRRTVFGYSLASSMTIAFGYFLYIASRPMQRAGCCLGIAAMLYTWAQLFSLRALRDGSVRDSSLHSPSYRIELQRQRDFYCGFRFWSRILIVVCGFVLFCVGGVVVHPDKVPAYALFAIFLLSMFYFAVWLNSRETRKYQDQIERLDRLSSQASNID